MIWVIAFCSLLMVALDYMISRRWAMPCRRVYMAVTFAFDLLPLLMSAIDFLLIKDNTTWFTLFSMWMTFLYMVLSIARMPMNLSFVFSRKMLWRVVGVGVSCACVALFVYGMAVTRIDYKVNRVVVTSQRLPKSFDGYRIVQISDLHVGTMLSPVEEVQNIVDICNSLDADMVAHCGDLVNIRYDELEGAVVEKLSQLRAKDGVFTIIGNHDTGGYIKDSISLTPDYNLTQLKKIQSKMGWRMIDDRSVYVKRGADSISITGVSFDRKLQDYRHSFKLPDVNILNCYNGVPKDLFNVSLVHVPQLWDKILEHRLADLTLSGHVHAMQMKFPIGKRGVSPSMLIYKRWSGLYQEQGRSLYINDGIGCVMYPMRIGTARPEITLIELEAVR